MRTYTHARTRTHTRIHAAAAWVDVLLACVVHSALRLLRVYDSYLLTSKVVGNSRNLKNAATARAKAGAVFSTLESWT